MRTMLYEDYESAVVAEARHIYPHPICIDNVKEFFDRGESVRACAEDAAFTSALDDGEVF